MYAVHDVTIHPPGHWSLVSCADVTSVHFVTESSVKTPRPRGLRQQGCPDPVISLLPRYPRPFHFPSLRCLLRFVSFPLAPVWAHLAPPCGTPVLLTYSSPLGFEKFSLFRHSWDHFSSRRTSDSHPGYCRVQDHQEIQEMPPVVPGEGRGGTTCILVLHWPRQR